MSSPNDTRASRVSAELERMDRLEWVSLPDDATRVPTQNARARFYELLLGANAACIYGVCEKDGIQRTAKILTGVAFQKYWETLAREGLGHRAFYGGGRPAIEQGSAQEK